LRLAQTFYLARLQELKTSIEEYEQNFSKLMTEITAIKSGSMDKVLKDEIRGVLARKYGKKLLDNWVPDEDAVKEAIEAGPPTEEELKEAAAPAVSEVKEAEKIDKAIVPEAEASVVEGTAEAEDKTEEPAEDIDMKETSPTKAADPLPPAEAVSSPGIDKDSALSPASDLSSVPGSPVKSTKAGRGNSKRKASTQPRGAPQSKRSTKRRTTATPALEEEAATEEPEKEEAEETQPEEAMETELVPETPAPVEEELPKRGRRVTAKRESVVRRESTRKATSPDTSTRHSSPINPKRAPSVSSARSNSATPAAEGRSRRGRNGRGVRDGGGSKLGREQSTAEESAKEDDVETPKVPSEAGDEAEGEVEEVAEEEPELPTTRSTRRNKSAAVPVEKEDEGDEEEADEEEKIPPRSSRRGKDVTTPVPDKKEVAEKKSTRRSSARGSKLKPSPSTDNQLTTSCPRGRGEARNQRRA
jgi:bromodomain-containing protein 8